MTPVPQHHIPLKKQPIERATEDCEYDLCADITQGLCDISWEHRDRYVATASDDHTVKLWEVTSGECLRTLEGHTHYVFCCAFNPLKPILVSSCLTAELHMSH